MTEYCPMCWIALEDYKKINDGLYKCNRCGFEFDKPIKQRMIA